MKVIFVGLHNKPGKMPLCSSTKSGKLIDRIANALGGMYYPVRTNLFNIDYLPETKFDKMIWANDWVFRIDPNDKDIIVLLGAEVKKYFPIAAISIGQVICVAHPASKRSHIEMNWYVEDTLSKIMLNSEQTPDECDATKPK